ncbi:MAG TPA: hypothetical protein PLV92_01785 [Pirellulaceae bacterium]|nr:hypothetical protein [Pirellulaceae bacterium]
MPNDRATDYDHGVFNAYAVLAGFLSLVQLGVGTVALLVGARLLYASGSRSQSLGRLASPDKSPPPESLTRREDRLYLAVVLGTVQLIVTVVGWPLLYLLLQSYVPRWPGVMCIYGVLRIGSESDGAAGWLPTLLSTLQCTKPIGVLLAGAWFELYRLDRSTSHSPLARRVVGLLVLTSALTVVDSAVELSYLAIPKQDESLSVGCCTAPADSARWSQRLPTTIWTDDSHRLLLVAAAVVANGLFVGGLMAVARACRRASLFPMTLAALGVGVVASLPANLLLLTHWLAPSLLHLPYHACPYDLVSRAPESLVGLAAVSFGYLAASWAAMLLLVGRVDGGGALRFVAAGRLSERALLGLLIGATLLGAELALNDLRPPTGCHYDGQPIDARHQVRVEIEGEVARGLIGGSARGNRDGLTTRRFCSLACVEAWLAASKAEVKTIWVTDERTGAELPAHDGYYVRSRVISHPWTRDRRHVFARESDARAHAESFQGRLLEGEQRPRFAR